MTVELRPLGVACNIACEYCYQQPMRDAGNVNGRYDIDKMLAATDKIGGPFSLFGGEPLLIPKPDLERLWKHGLSRYGSNGIQTNGVLIDEDHIRMFRSYRVHVGISIDGPGALNDVRSAGKGKGKLEKTRSATQKTLTNIATLIRHGLTPSLIITLHRGNCIGADENGERLDQLLEWFRQLDSIGIRSSRLHVLESESEAIRESYGMSAEEYFSVFQRIHALESDLLQLRFDVFAEIRSLLLGDDTQASCVWNACDPYTTRAVQGIEGNGAQSNCGRTNKDGVDFVKGDRQGFERYIALYHTPQDHGGCSGCRYFLFCKGNCPGTSIEGDWRMRSEHCELWMKLFAHVESQLLQEQRYPISVQPIRQQLEERFLQTWQQGDSPSLRGLVEEYRARGESMASNGSQRHPAPAAPTRTAFHGDHTDNENPIHGDSYSS